ncbi:MAG: GntR family transcriptional regulator [Anaerovoracaceae bacterium]|jgi:DNA-binding GntR family transcriptional regulator|nr:GntR family transcriptional regulator [Anaerovoracaceae bacterium]
MINFDLQRHKPLRDLVYDELKMKIMMGLIAPGTRMMEVELAEEMGVSRTPVREAIRKLEKEGMISIEPRRGAYASSLSNQDMVDILEVRQTMEGLAADLATIRFTEEQKNELLEVSQAFNQAVEKGDMEQMISLDTLFHHLIVQGTGNKLLAVMVGQLQDMVLRFRYLYYDDFRRAEKMPQEHKEILDAILGGDPVKARMAADNHIDGLKQMVIAEKVK